MKLVEFFCGTKSISNVAETLGFETFTSDSNKRFKPDYCINVLNYDLTKVPFIPDAGWFSPPCTQVSVASMWKHWNKDYTPKSLAAVCAIDIFKKTLKIIEHFISINPKFIFYVENPRGMLRHLNIFNHLKRHTVSYCQYGDTRMKPTDIWTNDLLWTPKPLCKVTDKCHSSQTNDLSTAAQRSVIPYELCMEVLQSCANNIRRTSDAWLN